MEVSAQKKKEAAFQRRMRIEHSMKNRLKQQSTNNRAVFYDLVKVDPEKHKDDLRDKFNESFGQFEDIWGNNCTLNQPSKSHSNNHSGRIFSTQSTNNPKLKNQTSTASKTKSSSIESSSLPTVLPSQLTQDLHLFKKQQFARAQSSQKSKTEHTKSSSSHSLKSDQSHKELSSYKPAFNKPFDDNSRQNSAQPSLAQDTKNLTFHQTPQQPTHLVVSAQNTSLSLMQFAEFQALNSYTLLDFLEKMLKDLKPASMLSPLVHNKTTSSSAQNTLEPTEEKLIDTREPSYNEELFGKFESDDDEEEEEEIEEGELDSSSMSSSSDSRSLEKFSEKSLSAQKDDEKNSWNLSSIVKQINEDSKSSLTATLPYVKNSPATSLVNHPHSQSHFPSSPASSLHQPSNAPQVLSPYHSFSYPSTVAPSFLTNLQNENSQDVSPESSMHPPSNEARMDEEVMNIPVQRKYEAGELESMHLNGHNTPDLSFKSKTPMNFKRDNKHLNVERSMQSTCGASNYHSDSATDVKKLNHEEGLKGNVKSPSLQVKKFKKVKGEVKKSKSFSEREAAKSKLVLPQQVNSGQNENSSHTLQTGDDAVSNDTYHSTKNAGFSSFSSSNISKCNNCGHCSNCNSKYTSYLNIKTRNTDSNGNSTSGSYENSNSKPCILPQHHSMPAIELVFSQHEVHEMERWQRKRKMEPLEKDHSAHKAKRENVSSNNNKQRTSTLRQAYFNGANTDDDDEDVSDSNEKNCHKKPERVSNDNVVNIPDQYNLTSDDDNKNNHNNHCSEDDDNEGDDGANDYDESGDEDGGDAEEDDNENEDDCDNDDDEDDDDDDDDSDDDKNNKTDNNDNLNNTNNNNNSSSLTYNSNNSINISLKNSKNSSKKSTSDILNITGNKDRKNNMGSSSNNGKKAAQRGEQKGNSSSERHESSTHKDAQVPEFPPFSASTSSSANTPLPPATNACASFAGSIALGEKKNNYGNIDQNKNNPIKKTLFNNNASTPTTAISTDKNSISKVSKNIESTNDSTTTPNTTSNTINPASISASTPTTTTNTTITANTSTTTTNVHNNNSENINNNNKERSNTHISNRKNDNKINSFENNNAKYSKIASVRTVKKLRASSDNLLRDVTKTLTSTTDHKSAIPSEYKSATHTDYELAARDASNSQKDNRDATGDGGVSRMAMKRKQELERLSDQRMYKELIKKSPQRVYDDAKKLIAHLDSLPTNVNGRCIYENILMYTEATSCLLAHSLMTNCRNVSTIDYLFKNLQSIEQQLMKLSRSFEVTRLRVLLLRLRALVNLHAYNIRVGQKGSENFKAVVDKLRTANEEPSPKQSPDSSTNMANDAKKAVSHMTSQSLILGMDLKELNEYAYTTTFLQLAHQSFDESNRRARADLACKAFYSRIEKRFGVLHFYLHAVNLMVYVRGAIQSLRDDMRESGRKGNEDDEDDGIASALVADRNGYNGEGGKKAFSKTGSGGLGVYMSNKVLPK